LPRGLFAADDAPKEVPRTPMYCGLADLTIYLHREIYNYCHALLGMPRYYDRPTKSGARHGRELQGE